MVKRKRAQSKDERPEIKYRRLIKERSDIEAKIEEIDNYAKIRGVNNGKSYSVFTPKDSVEKQKNQTMLTAIETELSTQQMQKTSIEVRMKERNIKILK